MEKNRERYGKLQKAKQYIFQHYINGYLRNADTVEDLLLVPITINYDKVYES